MSSSDAYPCRIKVIISKFPPRSITFTNIDDLNSYLREQFAANRREGAGDEVFLTEELHDPQGKDRFTNEERFANEDEFYSYLRKRHSPKQKEPKKTDERILSQKMYNKTLYNRGLFDSDNSDYTLIRVAYTADSDKFGEWYPMRVLIRDLHLFQDSSIYDVPDLEGYYLPISSRTHHLHV